jgi:hypothetical protein
VFLVNLPIGVATVLCGLRVLARTPAPAEPLPDVLGAALLALAVGALSAALGQAPSWGWSSARTLGRLGLATAGLAVFAVRSRRHAHPLMEFALLRTPTFGASSAATFLFSVGFATMLL